MDRPQSATPEQGLSSGEGASSDWALGDVRAPIAVVAPEKCDRKTEEVDASNNRSNGVVAGGRFRFERLTIMDTGVGYPALSGEGLVCLYGGGKLVDSTVTGSTTVDIVTFERPKLVNSTCGTSRQVPSGVPPVDGSRRTAAPELTRNPVSWTLGPSCRSELGSAPSGTSTPASRAASGRSESGARDDPRYALCRVQGQPLDDLAGRARGGEPHRGRAGEDCHRTRRAAGVALRRLERACRPGLPSRRSNALARSRSPATCGATSLPPTFPRRSGSSRSSCRPARGWPTRPARAT